MTADTILTVTSVVITILIAGVGIEMANNPPSSSRDKWIYRLTFIGLGAGLVAVSVLISIRTNRERRAEEQRANAAEMQINGDLQFVKGQLAAFGDLMRGVAESGLNDAGVKELARAISVVTRSRQGQSTPNSEEVGRLADLSDASIFALATKLAGQLELSWIHWNGSKDNFSESYAHASHNDVARKAKIMEEWEQKRRDTEIGVAPLLADANLVRKEILRRTHLENDRDKTTGPRFENASEFTSMGVDDAAYLRELASRLNH
jgi:hypothetical protein